MCLWLQLASASALQKVGSFDLLRHKPSSSHPQAILKPSSWRHSIGATDCRFCCCSELVNRGFVLQLSRSWPNPLHSVQAGFLLPRPGSGRVFNVAKEVFSLDLPSNTLIYHQTLWESIWMKFRRNRGFVLQLLLVTPFSSGPSSTTIYILTWDMLSLVTSNSLTEAVSMSMSYAFFNVV